RKRTEARLRASEADLGAALDHAAAGIAFVAPDGRWLRVNERLCELVGYPQAELLALRFQDITHPDDLDRDLAQLARLLRGEIDSYGLEKRYIRKDGRCIWIHLSVSLICNEDGTPNHFVSVIEDIDIRKNAEQDSRRVRGWLKGFLDHLPGLAAIKDRDLRLLFANCGLQAALNLDEAQIVGRSNRELFPGNVGETLDTLDRRAFESGETAVAALAYDGRIYQTTRFIIQQDDGPPLLGAIALDVTRRHRLEQRAQALLAINERAGTLGEKAFLVYGLEVAERLTASDIGFLHFVNDDQETIELSTWTAGALEDCRTVFDSHYPITEAGIWADCCRERRAVVFNDYGAYAARRGLPEGHAPLRRLISVPVIDNGAVRMVVGVGNKVDTYDDLDVETVQLIGNEIWSVVRRARAEAALARRLAEVIELNSKLEDAHLQLLQSEKMSAIGQLAAGVAHELNNPIGFVYSNLGTLGEYVEDLLAIDAGYSRLDAAAPAEAAGSALAEVRRLKAACDHAYLVEDLPKLIHESKEGLERVQKIVRDLKDFSRVGESEWQWMDLEKGIESTVNIVWNELKYKAEVERHYTPLPPVRCLASQLNQVFMNLLVNAAQA
ncbi:MAG: PAS domain S-box protein, partial [Candidatus Accumulibacter sp.]|nr:PAS domain S-box protein [Accumulibacter sp.]